MSRIAVQVAELGRLGSDLVLAGDDLRRVAAGMAAVAGEGLDPRVERALTDVVSGWRGGVDLVGESTATAGRQVVEATRSYEETERALTDAAGVAA